MFTAVIPISRKDEKLEEKLRNLIAGTIKKYKADWQMVVSDSATPDISAEICRRIAREYKTVKIIHLKKSSGIGASFKKSLEHIKGDVIIIDPDCAPDSSKIPELLGKFKDKLNGPDIISYASNKKNLCSMLYNTFINFMFKTKIRDYESRFMGFKESVFKHLCIACTSEDEFWLTESLVRALKMDYIVTEIPAEYECSAECDLFTKLKKAAQLRKDVKL